VIRPTTGDGVIWATSSDVETEVSSSSRTTASPTPSSSPSTSPRPMLRTGCGETGELETWALSTISALISALLCPGGVSRVSTSSLSASA